MKGMKVKLEIVGPRGRAVVEGTLDSAAQRLQLARHLREALAMLDEWNVKPVPVRRKRK